jgi:hypothetical protein
MTLKAEMYKELSKPTTMLYCMMAFLIGALIWSGEFSIKEVSILAVGFMGFSLLWLSIEGVKQNASKSDN